MQGMGRKRAVVHSFMSHDEQDSCQGIGESESERPQERFQIEHHQGQEEEERGVVGPSVDTMEPEGECDERDEQKEDITVDGTFDLFAQGIIRRGTAIPYCDDENTMPSASSTGKRRGLLNRFCNSFLIIFKRCFKVAKRTVRQMQRGQLAD